jgi:hypothetical protein
VSKVTAAEGGDIVVVETSPLGGPRLKVTPPIV